MITVTRTGPCMGAEIAAIDLAQPVSDAAFGEIRDALHRHHVLVLRGQSLQPRQFHAFASRFGQPEPHVLDQFHHPEIADILILSNVQKDSKPTGLADGGTYWHTDYSYLTVPARATVLYSVQVPQVGGDTLFADQEQAYADLPADMQRRIDDLVTINVYGNRDIPDLASRESAFPPSDDQKAVRGMVVTRHPLVRHHPYTGRKALYAVSGTSYGIEGMSEDDGLALLRELAAHSTQPRYRHRVRYGVGDVVLWDNASVLHSATLTDPVYPRTLLRVTTKEAGRTMVQ